MYINPLIATVNNQYYGVKNRPNFTSKPDKLAFKAGDFFVNIKGYGRNKSWAEVIIDIANKAVDLIKNRKSSDEVLQEIAKGANKANQHCQNYRKKLHTGVLRTEREGYGKSGEWRGIDLYTPIVSPYDSYFKKLLPISQKPLKSPYRDIHLAQIETGNWLEYYMRIVHPDDRIVNNALDRVSEKYSVLEKDYISKPKNVTASTLPDITSNIAEIRWIMAHSMPWERGSDSISNVFIRSLYKSMGIKTYPLKRGISLDLEAFCTPLDEYKNKFANYFTSPPDIVGK